MLHFLHKIINAVDFQIALEDEGKVIGELAAEIRNLVGDMKYKVESVAEGGVVERQAIKEELKSEIEKVYNLTDISHPCD